MENRKVFNKIHVKDRIQYKHPTKETEEWEVLEEDRLFVTLIRIPDGELWRVSKWYINKLHPEMFRMV